MTGTPPMRGPERWLGPLRSAVGVWFRTAVFLGPVSGCLALLASGSGLFLVVNYGLAVAWQGSAQHGFHSLLISTLIVIFATRAGRVWGVDGWVRARRPGSWLARLPLG